MGMLLSAQVVDPRRWVLAAVLALIAVALIVGGVKLISLGGSPYYVIAGLVVLISAYFTSRGDARGRTFYAILLIGTLIWAIAERGTNGWALQARLFAPLVLSLWVFWPWFRDYPRILAAVVIVALTGLGWLFFCADAVTKPSASSGSFENGATEWHHYGNDLGGQRYAQLGQITPDNVGQLKEVWRMQTGGVGMGFEATPLFVKDTIYVCTPTSVIIAIDPDTGERRWTYDSKADVPEAAAFCRGVAYYAVPNATGACSERIYMSTVDARLVAVDARDGQPCAGFGENGIVDLKVGLGDFPKGYWHTTSAPEVIRGNVIFNSYVLDNQYVGEPSGVIRAFDAITGKMVWAWDMDRPDNKGAPPEGQLHSLSTANSWGPIAGDEELGLVYLPMGNATPDYFGAQRSPASEKYSSGIVALDATTGNVRWHYQITHHDIWDYDVAAQPTLVDFKADDGSTIPAVIQQNKRGETFVFDRRDGKPLTKVEERPVPQGAAEGEWLSPTQPFSTGMPAFDRREIAERTMWGMTPLDQLWCRIRFREMRWDGPFTPPGLKPNIVYPSYSGGVDWAGVAVDPERHLMVVNWLQIANYTQLVPRAVADAMGTGVPKEGKLQDLDKPMPQKGTPYAAYAKPFWSPMQVPCTEPPYGSIAVVDLDKREIIWQKPLGSAADSGPFGLRHFLPLPMGVPNQGGSVVTKSGLIFISATQEQAIRALDLRDGRKLWSARLPAGGQATPMTFISPKTGKQYVVIAAGGNYGLVTKLADYVIAYALP